MPCRWVQIITARLQKSSGGEHCSLLECEISWRINFNVQPRIDQRCDGSLGLWHEQLQGASALGWAPAPPRDAELPGLGLRSGTAPGAHAELSAPAPGNQPGLCAEAWGVGLSPHPAASHCGPGARQPVLRRTQSQRSSAARSTAPRPGYGNFGARARVRHSHSSCHWCGGERPFFVSL